MRIERREFLGTAAGAALSWSVAPVVRAAAKAPRYRTALIGCGWWGMNVLREALAAGSCQVAALCDVDQDALEVSADEVSSLTSDEPKRYGDFRELFDREEIDVAIIATPDHWHALQTIAALQAGAHVYVEKPTGHTIGESRAMVSAAEQADRVVQVGLHRRIGPHHVSGMQFLNEGRVGEIGMVRMFAHSRGGSESPAPNGDPPAGLDWNLYCGPAPLRPFNRKIHPGGFRHFLDYANGTLGDWGVHWLDQLLWWSEEQHPHTVYSTGGRPIRGEPVLTETEQTTDAPDSQVAVYEFDGFTATWEHRRFAGNEAEKHSIGAYFYGTGGAFHMGWRDGWTFYPAGGGAPVHGEAELQEPDGHNVALLWADFLAAIETGKKPAAEIEASHRSTTLSLLGMLSYKLGRSIRWDGERERILDDDEANTLLTRAYRAPWVYPTA